jgi:hypothetical protein
MPLLDLKTDLKSIKYGHDRAGGGSSGQPYIKTDINTVDKGINRLRFGNFDDGLVRGGVIGMLNSSITDTLRIGKFLTDTPKGPLFIVKQVGLQLSNPRLESKEVKVDRSTKGGSFVTNAINFISNVAGKIENAVGPTRIYNLGINTLAQVPLNGIGGHVVRHGFLPVSDPSKYYSAVATHNNENGTNRLELLTAKFQLGDKKTNLTISKDKIKLLNAITNVVGKLTGITVPALKPTQLTISNYIGGPSSVYGIGNTLISRTTFTEDKFKVDLALKQSKTFAGKTRDDKGDPQEIKQIDRFFGASNVVSSSLSTYSFDPSTKKGPISNNDNNIPKNLNNNIAKSSDTGSYNRDSTLPERKNENDLVVNGPSSYDPSITGSFKYALPSLNLVYGPGPLASYAQITKLNPSETTSNLDYGNTNTNPSASSGVKNQSLIGNQLPKSSKNPTYKNNYGDVITFRKPWNTITREIRVGSGRKDQINLTPIFDNINKYDGSDTQGTHNIRDLVKFRIQAVNTDGPDFGSLMVFRAYLTALSDSVDAQWTDIKYAGRGDKFYIYDGFSRKMSVSFKVAALSAEEMRPMYQKLNYLMSNLMPDYSNNLMRGPLVRMTIGNYIDAQLCKLDSVSYTTPQDSPWEIAMDEPEGGEKYLILPHIIEVQLNFTPIGSESKKHNELQSKSQTISHIAQNNTGDNVDFQYIK